MATGVVVQIKLRWWFRYLFLPMLIFSTWTANKMQPGIYPREDFIMRWLPRGVKIVTRKRRRVN